MKKKDNHIILIIIVVILISILGIISFSDKDEEDVSNKNVNYNIVVDYSRFFTVNSCIYKYFSYLSSKNYDNLFKVLDSEYIEKNSLNEDNILDFLPDLDGNYTFVSKKMYYQKVNDDYYIYYVYGYAEEDTNDKIGDKSYYYFKVNFDQKNSIFSITPINSNIFEEVSNG